MHFFAFYVEKKKECVFWQVQQIDLVLFLHQLSIK